MCAAISDSLELIIPSQVQSNPMNENPQSEFEKAAADQPAGGLIRELVHFLLQNKKWWLVPILLALLILGALMLLSSTAVAPFIYTLF